MGEMIERLEAEERIARLRETLAALHYEALVFPRREGSPFDMAMSAVEAEFGNDRQFRKRFDTNQPSAPLRTGKQGEE